MSQRAASDRTCGPQRTPGRRHERRRRLPAPLLCSHLERPRELRMQPCGTPSSEARRAPTRALLRSLRAGDHHLVAVSRRSAGRAPRSSPPTARSRDGPAAQDWPTGSSSPRSPLDRLSNQLQKDHFNVGCRQGATLVIPIAQRALCAARKLVGVSVRRSTVDEVRREIISAIAELRVVARSEGDGPRDQASDWLEQLFAGIEDQQALRRASARGLGLYRGGMGSFQDVGSAGSSKAVSRLRVALRRGRSWFPRA